MTLTIALFILLPICLIGLPIVWKLSEDTSSCTNADTNTGNPQFEALWEEAEKRRYEEAKRIEAIPIFPWNYGSEWEAKETKMALKILYDYVHSHEDWNVQSMEEWLHANYKNVPYNLNALYMKGIEIGVFDEWVETDEIETRFNITEENIDKIK